MPLPFNNEHRVSISVGSTTYTTYVNNGDTQGNVTINTGLVEFAKDDVIKLDYKFTSGNTITFTTLSSSSLVTHSSTKIPNMYF